MQNMKKEIYCTIEGEVQGVFYRAFAKEKADNLGVFGYAKNTDDGKVEVVAQGEEETLKTFLESIGAGPENAQVDSLSIMWGKIEEPYTQFDIL